MRPCYNACMDEMTREQDLMEAIRSTMVSVGADQQAINHFCIPDENFYETLQKYGSVQLASGLQHDPAETGDIISKLDELGVKHSFATDADTLCKQWGVDENTYNACVASMKENGYPVDVNIYEEPPCNAHLSHLTPAQTPEITENTSLLTHTKG